MQLPNTLTVKSYDNIDRYVNVILPGSPYGAIWECIFTLDQEKIVNKEIWLINDLT